jgi:hypothetical protein
MVEETNAFGCPVYPYRSNFADVVTLVSTVLLFGVLG